MQTIPTAKNSAVWVEFSTRSKHIFPSLLISSEYFEEMKYIIYYVKFKMWSAVIYANLHLVFNNET